MNNLIPLSQAVKLLGYKQSSTVRKALSRGYFEATKIGSYWFFTPAQLQKALNWRQKRGKLVSIL